MKSLHKRMFPGLLVVVVGSLYQPLQAQPDANKPDKAADKAVDKPVEKKVEIQLSPEEMKKVAQEHRAKVRVHLQHVQHLQALSRKEADIIKLNCVNDKFVKMKAEANIFDLAHSEMIALIETSERNRLFKSVEAGANSIRQVREEADSCIGSPELGGGENDFTQPELRDDPTVSLPFDIEVEPPAYASPFI